MIEPINWILASGRHVDLSITNSRELNVIQEAEKNGYEEIVKLLHDYRNHPSQTSTNADYRKHPSNSRYPALFGIDHVTAANE